MNRRVLIFEGGEAAARTAVDWMAAHQGDCEVVVAGRGSATRPIGRMAHPPFREVDPGELETAVRVAAVIAAADPAPGRRPPGAPGSAPTGPTDPGAVPSTPTETVAPALVAAVLAVGSGAVLIASGRGLFGDLVGVSAWSMNVSSRPTDSLMARHTAIAERAWPRLAAALAAASPAAAGEPLVTAFLGGDSARLATACRARRRAARADGPARFRRIAAKSAGLRPFAIYLDLLPSLAAAGEPARAVLRDLGPGRAADLLAMSIALFL